MKSKRLILLSSLFILVSSYQSIPSISVSAGWEGWASPHYPGEDVREWNNYDYLCDDDINSYANAATEGARTQVYDYGEGSWTNSSESVTKINLTFLAYFEEEDKPLSMGIDIYCYSKVRVRLLINTTDGDYYSQWSDIFTLSQVETGYTYLFTGLTNIEVNECYHITYEERFSATIELYDNYKARAYANDLNLDIYTQ